MKRFILPSSARERTLLGVWLGVLVCIGWLLILRHIAT
jgi:hypothetical protein